MKTILSCLIFVVAFSSVGNADRQLKEYDNDVNYDDTKVPHDDFVGHNEASFENSIDRHLGEQIGH